MLPDYTTRDSVIVLPTAPRHARVRRPPIDPAEAIKAVKDAAAKIENLQLKVWDISTKAHALLDRTKDERGRAEAELEAARSDAGSWHERALSAESTVLNIRMVVIDQALQLEQAEMREREATRRAELADRRCRELEDLLRHLSSRLLADAVS